MKKFLLIPFALMLLAATYGPPFSVSDFSSLTNRPNPSAINPTAIVVNGTNSLDAAGGLFVYLPTATNAVDNDTYFASTTTGRWVRVDRQLKTIVNPLLLSGGRLSLANSSVVPGTYTNTILTVNSNGLVTFATNGTISASGSSSNWYAYIYSISTLVTNFALVGNDTLSTYGPLTWHVTGGTNIYADIASHTITDAMLDYVPTNTLKGSDMATAAGSIASVGDIQIGANLQLSGGVLSAITSSGTNSWQIGVDGTVVNTPNLADGTYVTVSASGTNVTFSIPDSGASAGTYTNATVTVNAKGFVTSISSGTGGGGGGGGDVYSSSNNVFTGTNTFTGPITLDSLTVTNLYADSLYFPFADGIVGVNSSSNAFKITIGANLSYSGGTLSATGGGGGTNGTPVTVDGGADLARANFADSTGIGFTASGSNVTAALVDRDFGSVTVSSSGTVITYDNNSISSNHIAAGQVSQDKLATSGTGLSTNFLAGDYTYKQVTTNMIPGLVGDIANLQRSLTFTNGVTNVNNTISADLAAGSNITFATNNGKITISSSGGGGGSVFVNGSSVSNPNFTNSSTALWNVSGTNVSLTITNVPGTTTSNVLQWLGSAYFVVTNNSTIGDFSSISTNGIIYAASCVDCQNDSPGIIEFSFPSRSTNYIWTLMPEGNVNGYVAYEAAGYRGTNSLRIKIHEAAGSVFFTGGYWMRFDMWDKVAVGGSGGGSSLVGTTSTNTLYGVNAGQSLTTGNFNTIIGYNAGTGIVSGASSVLIGYQAGNGATNNLSFSTFVGTASASVLQADFNTGFGYHTGNQLTTGSRNSFLGYRAGDQMTNANDNVAIGYDAGGAAGAGSRNVFIGVQAGGANTTANDNVYIGYQAGQLGTTSDGNTFIGAESGETLTAGANNNSFYGYRTGRLVTSGYNNTFLGYGAGNTLTTGFNNIFLGVNVNGATNQQYTFLAGGAGQPITNVYFGEGIADASPSGFALRATSGTGTDIAGASITFAAGQSTGSGAGGSLIFQTSPAGSTGTTTNALVSALTIGSDGKLSLTKTVTAGGTTSAQTINKVIGSVNLAASATSVNVTNSLVDANSIIIGTVASNDTTTKSVAIVAGSGYFTIYPNAAPTAETRINWMVLN